MATLNGANLLLLKIRIPVSLLLLITTTNYSASRAIALESPSSSQPSPSSALSSTALPPSPAIAPPASSPRPTPRIEAGYTLGAGDRIQVDVFQLPQYSGEHEIMVDGTVTLPVVGKVNLNGLTLEQASGAIAAQYSQTLRQPIITVSLLARRTIQVGIAGEVNRPGSYTINPSDTQFPTLTQVLEQAGGIRMAADLHNIQIRRRTATAEQTIKVDLWQLLHNGDLSEDITLRDGDAILVPTATNIDVASTAELSNASFAPEDNRAINIAVVGEVFRPGPYTVTGTARTGAAGVPGGNEGTGQLPTVTRAIQVAGGIKPMADVRHIEIRRPTRSGTEQTLVVNLWQLLQAGDLTQDALLQEGDTVFVPTAEALDPEETAQLATASFSPDTIRVNVVGEVTRPGVVEVPPNTPLNQAILAAGGLNNRAQRHSVELVRLNPNGTVAARTLPIDFAQGINEANNPALRNNDVIIVDRSAITSVSDTLDTVLTPLGRFFTLFTLPFQFLRLF